MFAIGSYEAAVGTARNGRRRISLNSKPVFVVALTDLHSAGHYLLHFATSRAALMLEMVWGASAK